MYTHQQDSPLSILFSRMNRPSSFSLFLHEQSSRPFIISMLICRLYVACPSDSTPDLSLQCWTEEKDYLLWHAGNDLPNAAQNVVSLLCGADLLAHGPPGSQGISLQRTLPAGHLLVFTGGCFILSQAQHFAPPPIELHCMPFRPILQLIEVPLNNNTTIWCIGHSSQFCIIYELSESKICPSIQVIYEEVYQDLPQYWPLVTTSDLSSARLCATDHSPLGPAAQPVFNSPHCSPTKPILCQLVCEDVMQMVSEVLLKSRITASKQWA